MKKTTKGVQLDKFMDSHLKDKAKKKRQGHKLKSKLSEQKQMLLKQANARVQVSSLVQYIFKKRQMPMFVMYSRLDPVLLKIMIIKAAEFADFDLAELRKEFRL